MKLTQLQIESIKEAVSYEVKNYLNYSDKKVTVYVDDIRGIDADLEFNLVTPQITNSGLTLVAELVSSEYFNDNGDSLKITNEEEITRIFIKCW